MDIEKDLKTIGDWISKETESRKYPKGELLELSESLQALNAETARQSVTSAEVQEAIVVVNEKIYRHREYIKLANKSSKVINLKPEYDKIDALELAITALQAYQPWVPVSERLPESGRHVLLCCEIRPSGKRYVCDGYYAKAKSTTSGYSNDWDCEYDEETDEYYLPEGYYEIIKNWGDYSSIAVEDFVTHWKPLPEIPKGE